MAVLSDGAGEPRLPVGQRSVRASASVRFGLIFASLFGLSAVGIAAFLWWSTAGLLDRRVDEAIMADSESLTQAYLVGGVPSLVESIEDRQALNPDDAAYYLLVDGAHRRLAGNLRHWPRGTQAGQSWAEMPDDSAGPRTLVRAHIIELDGGRLLLVGRDVRLREQVRHLLADALIWAAAAVLVLGVVGAVMVRGVLARMLANVSETARAISAGDLGRRVPFSGSGDEFDALAETINDMLDRIGRLMQGVREVSNAIAHDLRTPIARARVRLEDAAHQGASEAELRAGIERAIADLDGVVSVFQALLRIAEIEAGSRRSAFAALDLAPLLRDLGELYEAAADEGGRRLLIDVPPELPTIGDRDMLQQAVANLLDNALKFSPTGTEVKLTAGSLPGQRVFVMVADRGPGIPAADLPRATERFFRGEQARHAPGFGLGLALAQAVAVLHGGALRLEDNAPGLRAILIMATRAPERTIRPAVPAALPAAAAD